MKTKIICTIGPSCNTKQVLTNMIQSGMNFARLNMSHGTLESHQQNISLIKSLENELGISIPIILDTKGPEMRVGLFENNFTELINNQTFILTSRKVLGNNKEVSVIQDQIIEIAKIGDIIYANNGMLQLFVTSKTDTDIVCIVKEGGILSNNKGITIPNLKPSMPYISDTDKFDLMLAINNNVEWIAASFVHNAYCVEELKQFLSENNCENIKIISKIENTEGVANIDSIISVSDAIMIARGDLGVELAQEKVPAIQKLIVKKCKLQNKFCIVATEMLESMTFSIRPTRAEVSDVANAVYDGANAVMLSGETAVGKHPALVVETMRKIVNETEKHIK